jgi:dihydrofolate reductase
MMKSIIVAYDRHYGIGANNDLLWQRNLPADLKHFKEVTMSSAIIMGFNTYKSIDRPLPGRQNIVIDHENKPITGIDVVDSLQAAYSTVEPGRETFIIGGGQVYASSIDTVDRILVTEVDAVFDNATIFFPVIDSSKWREISREKHLADEQNLYNYDFVTYVRR